MIRRIVAGWSCSTAFAADLKLGYVNMAQALHKVDQRKAAKAQLERDVAETQARPDRLHEELNAKDDACDELKGAVKPEVRARSEQNASRSP